MKTRPENSGFTLVELLVVMAIIGLLVAILVPNFMSMRETTYSSICQNNLKRLAEAIHISSPENACKVPVPAEWAGYVAARGASSILRCPKDKRPAGFDIGSSSGGLEELQIKHDHCDGHEYWYSVAEALAGDVTKNAGNDIVVTTISDSEKEMWMDGMGSIRIKFYSTKITISIGSMSVCKIPTNTSGSNQYLYQGTKLLMQLRGKPPSNTIAVGTSVDVSWSAVGVSYGMNDLVPEKAVRMDQLMLMDWTSSVIDLYVPPMPAGNYTQDFDVIFATDGDLYKRHGGRANVATVGGGVTTLFRSELYPTDNPSLWKPRP